MIERDTSDMSSLLSKYKKNYGPRFKPSALENSNYLKELFNQTTKRDKFDWSGIGSQGSTLPFLLGLQGWNKSNQSSANEAIDSLLYLDDLKVLMSKMADMEGIGILRQMVNSSNEAMIKGTRTGIE